MISGSKALICCVQISILLLKNKACLGVRVLSAMKTALGTGSMAGLGLHMMLILENLAQV